MAGSRSEGCSDALRGATGRHSLEKAHECEERRIRAIIKMWEDSPETAEMSKFVAVVGCSHKMRDGHVVINRSADSD